MKAGNTGHKISQDSFKTKMKTIFYNLDIKNNICPDCGKTKSMDYASINNGIIICAECAKEHEKLGYNISFLRSLGDKWDDYLFNYIKAGGNSRFIQFCKDYKIDKGNNNIIQKYKSKGLTYYRDIIRSEVLGYDPPDNINVNKAHEEEPEIPDNYPEFKNYSFVKHVDKNYMETNFYTRKEEKPKEEEDEGFFGKIGGLWGSVKKKIGDEADDLMKKVSEIDYNSVKDSVKEKGASMFDYFFGDDKDKNNNESTNKIKENEKNDKNEDNSILKNIFGVNTKTYEEDKNINKIGNNYDKIEENDKGEYNNKEENKNTQIKENNNEQKKEKEEKKEITKEEQKKEKLEEKKEEKIEEIIEDKNEKNNEKKEEIKEEQKEEIKEEQKEEKKEEQTEEKIEEKKEDKNEKNDEKKEEQKEEIKEEQNNENKDEKNEEKAKEEEKNNSNNIIEKKDEQNIKKEKKDNKQEENAETKNYDIENILNDNTFSNDNTKMNNEEKDELEKMLQE